jgi:hypothetical protein
MQTVKPRVRVHAAKNQFSKNGFYYVVRGQGALKDVAVGCACIDIALRQYFEMVLLIQTMPC